MIMTIDTVTALKLMKTRLNRVTSDTSLDDYFSARIEAAVGELQATGIALTASTEDLLLVVDYAVWQYQNRDNPNAMPPWLRLRRRERWVQQGVKA